MGIFNKDRDSSSSEPKLVTDHGVSTSMGFGSEPPNFLRVPCFYRLPNGDVVLESRFLEHQDALGFYNSHSEKQVIAIGVAMDPDTYDGGKVCRIGLHVWADTMRWMSGTKGGVMMLVPILG